MSLYPLIPARAGIQDLALGPRFRGDERIRLITHDVATQAVGSLSPMGRGLG